MAISLSSLCSRVNGASLSDVRAAVADYSRRNPFYLYAEVSRGDEEKVYPLPDDFLFIIKLETPDLPKYYIRNKTLNFITRPYPDTLLIQYAGGHVLNESGQYLDLDEGEEHIIELKLRAMVARKLEAVDQDGEPTLEGLRYRDGDVEVDTKGVADSRNRSVEALEAAYLKAIKARIGTVGVRSEYPDYSG